MQLDRELVTKVAQLARLQVDEVNQQALVHYMREVTEHIKSLQRVNTDNIAPTFSTLRDEQDQLLHQDQSSESYQPLGAKRLLSNAPQQDGSQFVLKAVIEEQ